MITDDERRTAASKLRAMNAERIDSEYGGTSSLAPLTLGCIADAAGLRYAPYEFTSAELRDRLADLIEPTCDRDALLALADDIDKQTDGSMFDAWLEDGHYIARRIREAVGA